MSTIDLDATEEDARSSDASDGEPPPCEQVDKRTTMRCATPVRRFERITPDDVSHRSDDASHAMQRAKKRQRAVGEGSESEADAVSSGGTGSSAVEALAAFKREGEIFIDGSDEEAEMQADAEAQTEMAAAEAEYETNRLADIDKIVALGVTANRAAAQVAMDGNVMFMCPCVFHQ
jgi:hypothetical protein